MNPQITYLLLADLLLFIHFLFVVFVIAGLVLVLFGGQLGWHWIRNPWFRWGHLLAIGVVVMQSWFGAICPLTLLEMHLRRLAGDAVYSGSFISHWLETLLYYQVPAWVFAACYSIFGLCVVISWIIIRPDPIRSNRHKT
jgi:hypothetical protein